MFVDSHRTRYGCKRVPGHVDAIRLVDQSSVVVHRLRLQGIRSRFHPTPEPQSIFIVELQQLWSACEIVALQKGCRYICMSEETVQDL